MGAWIEILSYAIQLSTAIVAPLVGAWIEILTLSTLYSYKTVAPLVGAWIEIAVLLIGLFHLFRRSPCGSVD